MYRKSEKNHFTKIIRTIDEALIAKTILVQREQTEQGLTVSSILYQLEEWEVPITKALRQSCYRFLKKLMNGYLIRVQCYVLKKKEGRDWNFVVFKMNDDAAKELRDEIDKICSKICKHKSY